MFKYGKKKYMHGLAERGEIKIGTLYGYKYMEEQKKGVNDPLEGEYINSLYIDNHTFDGSDPDKDSLLRRELSPGATVAENVIINGITFSHRRLSPNRLIFCTSYENSFSVMKEFDADCCVEITNMNMFFKLITYELNKIIKNTFVGACKVEYGNYHKHNEIRKVKLPPELAKTHDFMGQKELRSIWNVPKELMHLINNDGYILKIPQLKKFCRIVEVKHPLIKSPYIK